MAAAGPRRAPTPQPSNTEFSIVNARFSMPKRSIVIGYKKFSRGNLRLSSGNLCSTFLGGVGVMELPRGVAL